MLMINKVKYMKKTTLRTALFLTVAIFSSCAHYNRLGDFTLISNRNIDSSIKYELVAREVEIKVKAKNQDPLESGIDELTAKYDGEYLMNVKLYMKKNGKKFKIVGDVYGIPTISKKVNTSVDVDIDFKYGDKVAFKKSGKLIAGKISGINNEGAVVEYISRGKTKRIQVSFDELTKLK